jgi:hypothetical protein
LLLKQHSKGIYTMKILIWAITSLLLLMWTGMIAISTAVVTWFAGLSTDPAQRGVQAIAELPLPEWITIWMPPAVLESVMGGTTGLLDSMVAAMTWLMPMMAWLNPVLWFFWALVVVLMLALAAGLHVLVGRGSNRNGSPPMPPLRA